MTRELTRNSSYGAALVEMAVAAPLMLLSIFGCWFFLERGYDKSLLIGALSVAGRDAGKFATPGTSVCLDKFVAGMQSELQSIGFSRPVTLNVIEEPGIPNVPGVVNTKTVTFSAAAPTSALGIGGNFEVRLPFIIENFQAQFVGATFCGGTWPRTV